MIMLLLTNASLETYSNLPYALESLESLSSAKASFLSELGIHRWSFWLQKKEEQVVCIHCFEGKEKKNFDDVLKDFQKQLRNKNPYALTIRQLIPEIFSRGNKIEKVLELDFYNGDDKPFPLYSFCYALPLLPDHLEEHREYCHQAMHAKKKETSQACKAFGMTHLSKWIQENDGEALILYYQVASLPVKDCRKYFLSLANDPKAQEATRVLRGQTGLKFNELCPAVDCIYVIE